MSNLFSAWTLGEFADLERQFTIDESMSAESLDRRDREIARRIRFHVKGDTAALRQWLDEVDARKPSRTGWRLDQILEWTRSVSTLCGFLLGAIIVWGWVGTHLEKPINVLHFWVVTVGLQLTLLVFGVLFVLLPARWLQRTPGISSIVVLARLLATAVPTMIRWMISRWSAQHRSALESATGEWKKVEKVYGRLHTLHAIRITQGFAVAFNIGAVLCLVMAGYVTDPAFGWQSSQLDDRSVQTVSRVISAPWSWTGLGESPTLEQVNQTRYRELEERYEKIRDAGQKPWGAWWGLLVGSILIYGLIPRVFLWFALGWIIRSRSARILKSHPSVARVLRRLKGAEIHSHLEGQEKDSAPVTSQPTKEFSDVSHIRNALRCHVLIWSGVSIEKDRIENWLQTKYLASIASSHTVGSIDPRNDASVLETVAQSDQADEIIILVGGWESPSGDYLDFIRSLRQRMDDNRPIRVVLAGRVKNGEVDSVKEDELRVWKHSLDSLGDPYVFVQCMEKGASE